MEQEKQDSKATKAVEVLDNFMRCWKRKKWAKMVSYTQITWKHNQANPSGTLKILLGKRKLKLWEIKQTEVFTKSVYDVTISLTYKIDNLLYSKSVKVRLICELAPYKGSHLENGALILLLF